jgi:hypothetical protein
MDLKEMAKPKGGLTKWFKERWVDISRPKKKGRYQPCGRPKARTARGGYPKCVPARVAARMSAAEKRSAVRRKRSKAQGVGGKPTFVRTFKKRGRRKKK